MRVLAAVDGSPGSFEAVRQVANLLTPGKDQLALYYAPPQLSIRSVSSGPELVAAGRQALAETVLAEAEKSLPAGLRGAAHHIIGTQDARHGILAAAKEWAADLIVMGARGLGRLERLLLGSVSRAVVHAAHIPVWVARATPGAEGKIQRVLLACHSAQTSRLPAQLLSRFAWPSETTLRTLTVVESLFAGQVPEWLEQQARGGQVEAMARQWARDHDDELKNAAAAMRELVPSLPAGFQSSEPLIAEGQPAAAILAAADREKIDLIVIGSPHRQPMLPVGFGSTCQAVLNHAGCSVLVVPHAEQP